MADYLASSDALQVDGILFPSVQRAANREDLNVVLFRKASQVEALQMPPGTQIDSRSGEDTDEGWEIGFSVIESRPAPAMRTEGVATRELPKLSFDEAMKPFDDGRGLNTPTAITAASRVQRSQCQSLLTAPAKPSRSTST